MNKFVTFLIVLLIIEAGVYSVMSTKKSFNSSPSSQTQHTTQPTSSTPTTSTPAPTTTTTPPKTTTTPPKTTTTTPKTTTSGGSTSSGSSSSSTSTSTSSQPGTYTAAEVAKHNSSASCYSIVDGGVYDLTNWISRHPGGQSAIKYMCGIDATDAFMSQHAGERRPTSILDQYKIGTLR